MKIIFKSMGWLLLLLVAMVMVFIALNWEPDRSVDELKVRWAQPPSQFMDMAGMQVHFRDEGPQNDPVPIVLIHGTSASLHTWNGWAAELKDKHRVIRFDLPGFGLTGPTADNDYSIESYVRFTVAVLDHLQVNRFVLAGNSLGGNVAFNTAYLYPERVDKLVLIDASGFPFKAQSIPLGFRIARMPVLNQLTQYVLPRSLVENSVKNVYGNPDLVTPELVDRYFDLTTRTGNRQALSVRLNQLRPGQHTDRLSELKLPTLILWGERDQLIPLEMAERFHQAITGSQLVLFEQLGHVPQEEDPSSTVAAFKSFLAQKANSLGEQ